MATLDATPMGASSNSYLTVADADVYLTELRMHTSAWAAAITANKEKSLMWATAIIDAAFDWYGYVRTTTQALRWPRSGIENYDGDWLDCDTIPAIIERSTAELANLLLQKDRMEEPELFGLGLKKTEAGSLKADIDLSMVLPIVPQHILVLLRSLGVLSPEASQGSTVAKVSRA